MGYGPPLIPPGIRREVLAAAEASSKPGQRRRSSSWRPKTYRYTRPGKLVDILPLPTESPTRLRSPNSPKVARGERGASSGGSPCMLGWSSEGGSARHELQSPPSQGMANGTGSRGRSCPPITRRVSADSRMVSRPRLNTVDRSLGDFSGGSHRSLSSLTRASSQDAMNMGTTRRRSSSEHCSNGNEIITPNSTMFRSTPSMVTRGSLVRAQSSDTMAMASANTHSQAVKLRFEALRRQPGNRYGSRMMARLGYFFPY